MNTHVHDASRRVDPTGTGGIRQRFQREMARRFDRLKHLMREALIEMDVLGLAPDGSAKQAIQTAQFARTFATARVRDRLPSAREFAFGTSSDKVAAFLEWLKQEAAAGILSVQQGLPMRQAASSSWANLYIDTAYQKGIRDAGERLRRSGAEVAPSWVSNGFNRPVHADRVGLIYTRTYNELEGITNAMSQKISRTLALGMAEGRNPRQIARLLATEIDGISKIRARLLARTEIIHAHAEASLNSYEEAGIEGVEVESEWRTAGDDRVCPQCEEQEGEVYSLAEAHGLIPLHPQCRCAWIPKIVNGSGITLQ